MNRNPNKGEIRDKGNQQIVGGGPLVLLAVFADRGYKKRYNQAIELY